MAQRSPTPVRGLPADAKRRLIFDAAREVILRRGFENAKMDEIAAHAGVGKGTLYNFFSSKDDLFLSLVLDGFERLRDLVDAEVEPVRDPWGRFEVAWQALMLKVFPDLNRQWAVIYQLWGLLARDPAARRRTFEAWRAMYHKREDDIAAAIKEGQKLGRFEKAIDPHALGLLLMAIFDGLLHRAMFDAERVDPQVLLRTVLDLVRRTLESRDVPPPRRRRSAVSAERSAPGTRRSRAKSPLR